MENASKALLMAGGILIAIITIALLVRSFTTIGIFQKAQLSEEEQAQLVEFNEQYTKYLGQYVYGTEVISVINKSFNNKSYVIKTTIKFNNGYSYTRKVWNRNKQEYEYKVINIKAGKELAITNEEDDSVKSAIDVINQADKKDDSLMRRAFKCTNVGYDSYGRVNSIKFEEKQWGDLR